MATPTKPTTPASPASPPANAPPVNRPQGSEVGGTVTAAKTYPAGSPRNAALEADSAGPDPQEAKLRPYALAATIAQDEVVVTAAQEQRERSEEIQEQGVEPWKADRDDRDPDDRPRTVAGRRDDRDPNARQRQVPGVSPTQIDAD